MSHFNNLEENVGSLRNKNILDIGSGRGDFIFDSMRGGANCRGIEINQQKINFAIEQGRKLGLESTIIHGDALSLPFKDNEFDFINVGEVIEHVIDPGRLLKQARRVLRQNGAIYISVHNRFGIYDTHFHIYFLGWMPRSMAEKYLSILGKQKDYEQAPDLQRISQMNYYTYGGFKKLASEIGFTITDIRENKIRKIMGKPLSLPVLILYRMLLRPIYFSTFHLLLNPTKITEN